jgi:hypothetical protein
VVAGNATRLKMPTVAASLELAGVSPGLALGLHAATVVAEGAVVWMVFRRGTGRWAMATLLTGCAVASPYAFTYDLPGVSFAILLAVAQMAREDRAWNLLELTVLIAAFLAPYAPFLTGAAAIQAGALSLVLLFAVLSRRALDGAADAA